MTKLEEIRKQEELQRRIAHWDRLREENAERMKRLVELAEKLDDCSRPRN